MTSMAMRRTLWLVVIALSGCDPMARERAAAAQLHATNAEAALERSDFARALAAADLATVYDPLDPRRRDLLLRVRLTAVATAPHLVQADRPAELDYQAEVLAMRDAARAPVYLCARAQLALARGDLPRADGFLAEAAKVRPDAPAVLVGQAMVLTRQDKADAAIPLLEKTLAADASNHAALATLGGLLVDRKEHDRAIDLLSRAAKIQDTAAVEVALAAAYVAKQRIAEVGDALKKAVALDPRHGEAHRRLGDWAFATGQDDFAYRSFAQAAQLGAEPLASFGLAMVALRRGEFGAAARTFDAVIAAAPQLAPAVYHAALAHEHLGDAKNALTLYDRYVALAEKTPGEEARLKDAQARLGRLRSPGGRRGPAAAPTATP